MDEDTTNNPVTPDEGSAAEPPAPSVPPAAPGGDEAPVPPAAPEEGGAETPPAAPEDDQTV